MKTALVVAGAMAGTAFLGLLGWFLCALAVAAANDAARERDWDWPESVKPSPAMGQPREDGGER